MTSLLTLQVPNVAPLRWLSIQTALMASRIMWALSWHQVRSNWHGPLAFNSTYSTVNDIWALLIL